LQESAFANAALAMGLHQPATVKCAPTSLTTPRHRFDTDTLKNGMGFTTQVRPTLTPCVHEDMKQCQGAGTDALSPEANKTGGSEHETVVERPWLHADCCP
jgi:hypothetical protein